MPRSCGLMRPSGTTAVASVNTSAAPPTARLPRWTRCQSVEKPSTLEYWHIGETTRRLASVTERRASGSNRCGMDDSVRSRGNPAHLCAGTPTGSERSERIPRLRPENGQNGTPAAGSPIAPDAPSMFPQRAAARWKAIRSALQTRLVLVAFIAVVPALCVIAIEQSLERRAIQARTIEDSVRFVRIGARQQASVLNGVHRLL